MIRKEETWHSKHHNLKTSLHHGRIMENLSAKIFNNPTKQDQLGRNEARKIVLRQSSKKEGTHA